MWINFVHQLTQNENHVEFWQLMSRKMQSINLIEFIIISFRKVSKSNNSILLI